jgi:hypothetical protein
VLRIDVYDLTLDSIVAVGLDFDNYYDLFAFSLDICHLGDKDLMEDKGNNGVGKECDDNGEGLDMADRAGDVFDERMVVEVVEVGVNDVACEGVEEVEVADDIDSHYILDCLVDKEVQVCCKQLAVEVVVDILVCNP